ncbi:hypothetical protein ACLB2K_053230 [Fragaria x ananassa]
MLKCLPRSFDRLKFTLETLDLSGPNLAGSLLEIVSSRTRHADETAVTNIPRPSCIVRLEGSSFYALRDLRLSECNLTDDSILVNFQGLSLDYLDLTCNGFRSLNNLSGLKVRMLILNECKDLAITDLPVNLNYLSLRHCISLEILPNYSYYSFPHPIQIEMWNYPGLIYFPGLVDWVEGLAVIAFGGHFNNMPSPLKKVILQDILNLEAGDSISLLVVLGDYYNKIHQIAVLLNEDDEPFVCFTANDLKSISYEEAKDLSDNDTGDNIDDDDDDDETNDSVDDDDTADSVEEAGASYSLFDADNGIVGDYSEDHEEEATHDPVDEDRPTKRLRRSDPSIVTVGGPENVSLQQQMLIQQLLSENEELRRQLILLQQPNPILVERVFFCNCWKIR